MQSASQQSRDDDAAAEAYAVDHERSDEGLAAQVESLVLQVAQPPDAGGLPPGLHWRSFNLMRLAFATDRSSGNNPVPFDEVRGDKTFWWVGNDALGCWNSHDKRWGLLSTPKNLPRTFLAFNHAFGFKQQTTELFLDGTWNRFDNVWRRSTTDKKIGGVLVKGELQKQPFQCDVAQFLTRLVIAACTQSPTPTIVTFGEGVAQLIGNALVRADRVISIEDYTHPMNNKDHSAPEVMQARIFGAGVYKVHVTHQGDEKATFILGNYPHLSSIGLMLSGANRWFLGAYLRNVSTAHYLEGQDIFLPVPSEVDLDAVLTGEPPKSVFGEWGNHPPAIAGL